MANLFYHLGNWIWDAANDCWRAPDGVVGLIDLAVLSAQGSIGPAQRPVGFFASSVNLGTDYALLGQGDLRELSTNATMRNTWQTLTGFRPAGANLIDLLADHLMRGSDPTGETQCRPLVPTASGELEIYLGGHSRVFAERFTYGTHGHTQKLRDLLRLDLIDIRTRSLNGECRGRSGVDLDFHRKYLDAVLEKYAGRNESGKDSLWAILRPVQWPANEGRQPHETTYSENFDGTDGDSIANLLTWTEVNGDWDRVSNKAELVLEGTAANRLARAEHDLTGNDNYAQAASTWKATSSNKHGTVARFQSGATTGYCGSGSAQLDQREIQKIIAGAFTSLDTQTQTIAVETLTVKLQVSGTTLSLDVGAGNSTITDTAIATGTRGGLFGRTATIAGRETQSDDFVMEDVVAGGGPFPHYTRRANSLSGGLITMGL